MKSKEQTTVSRERDQLAMYYSGIFDGKHLFDLQNNSVSYEDEEDFVSTLFELYEVLGKGYDYLVVVEYLRDLSFLDLENCVVYQKKNLWEEKRHNILQSLSFKLFPKPIRGENEYVRNSYIWSRNATYEWMKQIFDRRMDHQYIHLYLFEPQGIFPDLEKTMDMIKQETFLCNFEMDKGSHYITESLVDAAVFLKKSLAEVIQEIGEKHGRRFVLYDCSEKTSDDTYKG